MLRIQRAEKTLARLGESQFAEMSITERYDLQEFIFNSAYEFFSEIGLDLFILDKEVTPSDVVQDRIDLLVLDRQGRSVIIELKRGYNKLQLLQAIAYAGMIAKWTPDDLLSRLRTDKKSQFDEFIGMERDAMNREQRIILMAEAYDFEVLVAAEWLHENYGVDILCCRLSMAVDPGTQSEYLTCSIVYPAPELAAQSIPRRGRSALPARWDNWDAALAGISSIEVIKYFKSELEQKRESNLSKRHVCYRIAGTRRFYVLARNQSAYCWQAGRFEGDRDFWATKISCPETITGVASGGALSFSLTTEGDFLAFRKSATEELLSTVWVQGTESQDLDTDGMAVSATAGA